MVGPAQKHWPPYLAENLADTGQMSVRADGTTVVVKLDHKDDEIALGDGHECFWFPDTPHFFLLEWPKVAGDAPRPPPGLSDPQRDEEGRGNNGQDAEEREGGKRSREGSSGTVDKRMRFSCMPSRAAISRLHVLIVHELSAPKS